MRGDIRPWTLVPMGAREDLARLSITLVDVAPAVKRVVEVPLDLTLSNVRLVIQAVMPWLNCHFYEFRSGRQ